MDDISFKVFLDALRVYRLDADHCSGLDLQCSGAPRHTRQHESSSEDGKPVESADDRQCGLEHVAEHSRFRPLSGVVLSLKNLHECYVVTAPHHHEHGNMQIAR
jgi:hypothetical protein